MNASITFATLGPIFDAHFSILDFSGTLSALDFSPQHTILNTAQLNPPFHYGLSDVFIGPLLQGDGAEVRAVRVDFLLTSASAQVTTIGFELLSMQAVPEPSTWAMMILGFAGVGFMAYRRKKNALLAVA